MQVLWELDSNCLNYFKHEINVNFDCLMIDQIQGHNLMTQTLRLLIKSVFIKEYKKLCITSKGNSLSFVWHRIYSETENKGFKKGHVLHDHRSGSSPPIDAPQNF